MNALNSPSGSSWTRLQTELHDLAYILDRRGNPVAADLAATIAARIGELLAEQPAPVLAHPPLASRRSLP